MDSSPQASAHPTTDAAPLSKKDFATDQEVRWCPGCGDYAILNAVQSIFPLLGIPRERFVVVSGIGCSSRFPYYMNTFGFHTIHGRAPAIATGIKLSNPELSVWIATGDGDALSIGGNHIIHALRRNVGIKILMFNNRIYGLTKGQASPTSELGKLTKSSPYGTTDRPFNPMTLALGAGATFVARSVDVFGPHLKEVLLAAASHQGSAFVEILQNCNIFNDGAWETWTDKEAREEKTLNLVHDRPLVFGAGRNRGLRLTGLNPEILEFTGDPPDSILRFDTHRDDPTLAILLSHLGERAGFPMPIGIFRDLEVPAFEDLVYAQIAEQTRTKGEGTLDGVLNLGETWQAGGQSEAAFPPTQGR